MQTQINKVIQYGIKNTDCLSESGPSRDLN